VNFAAEAADSHFLRVPSFSFSSPKNIRPILLSSKFSQKEY
jgi:hypothetical protein